MLEAKAVVARSPHVSPLGWLAEDTIVTSLYRVRLGINEGAPVADLTNGAVALATTPGPEEDALTDQ